jgi:polysaccharide chain length determinant protein (PEP-CTERM system associated)
MGMDIKQRQLLKKYVDLLIQRWRLISICLLLGVTCGLGYYLYVPKVFQSSATLSYERQQINPAKMDPEQGKQLLQDSLATLKELVTSRNSLEKVIQQHSLYAEARSTQPIEDVIEMMRKNIEIKPQGKGDIFTVAFQGGDPQKVVRVTNALAALFIEENLKYREERATETSQYTEKELALSKKVLDEKEQHMRDYKLKFFNEMPDQRQSNLTQLQTLIKQNQETQNSIQELERTKVMAQEQARMQQQLAALSSAQSTVPHNIAPHAETDEERLERLNVYLGQLLEKYTEKHPEVWRTKQMIAQLESKGITPRSGNPQKKVDSSSKNALAASLEGQRLQAQVQQIDLNIQQLRQVLTSLPTQIAQYQKWIDAAPIREAEWNSLTRDYNEMRRHYDQLVANNLQAQSAENLERNQRGSKFKIVDSARLPDKPFKPNFLKILMIAVAGGLAVSVGFVVALDFIDTSFKDVGDLEDYIGVPVVCAIPFVEKSAETRRERFLFRLSLSLVCLYALALIIALVFMWIRGKIIV